MQHTTPTSLMWQSSVVCSAPSNAVLLGGVFVPACSLASGDIPTRTRCKDKVAGLAVGLQGRRYRQCSEEADVVEKLLAECGIIHRCTAAYHPQTNRLTDRVSTWACR